MSRKRFPMLRCHFLEHVKLRNWLTMKFIFVLTLFLSSKTSYKINHLFKRSFYYMPWMVSWFAPLLQLLVGPYNEIAFILAFLWQLMRYNILQLLKNLRFHSNGKEITDNDILAWANKKVKDSGKHHSYMQSFKVPSFNIFPSVHT
jgi:hypothetical protein